MSPYRRVPVRSEIFVIEINSGLLSITSGQNVILVDASALTVALAEVLDVVLMDTAAIEDAAYRRGWST